MVGELVDGCSKFTSGDVADHSINLVAEMILILELSTLQVLLDALEEPVVTGSEVGTVPRVQNLG